MHDLKVQGILALLRALRSDLSTSTLTKPPATGPRHADIQKVVAALDKNVRRMDLLICLPSAMGTRSAFEAYAFIRAQKSLPDPWETEDPEERNRRFVALSKEATLSVYPAGTYFDL